MKNSIIPHRRWVRVGPAALLISLAAAQGCSRTVIEAPPPDQTEVVVAAPGPDFVWIGGYWDRSWGRYVWVGGHWEHPDHPHAAWEKPRWEHRGDRFVFVEGRWH